MLFYMYVHILIVITVNIVHNYGKTDLFKAEWLQYVGILGGNP